MHVLDYGKGDFFPFERNSTGLEGDGQAVLEAEQDRAGGVGAVPQRRWVGLGATIGFSVAQPTQAEAPMSIDRPGLVQFAQATPSTATSVNEKDAIHKVLSGYYDAFGRDSAAASAFYGEPTLIVLPSCKCESREKARAGLAQRTATRPAFYTSTIIA
jgi:hypothetical protein